MDKILIAEDDRIFQGFLRTMLQKYRDRFEVISANNGEEALDSFLREQKIED